MRKIEQVRCLGFVELQGADEGVKDGFGDAGEVSAFHACVVGGGDSRDLGDLFPPQSRHPTLAPEHCQTGGFRGESGAQGREVLLHLALVVHTSRLRACLSRLGDTGVISNVRVWSR